MSPTTTSHPDLKATLGGLLGPLTTGLPRLLSRFGHVCSIGLDLGPGALNMVQFERAGGRICMRAAIFLPCDCRRDDFSGRPQRLREILKQAYAQQPFKGKRVVSSLPAGEIKIITVNYKQVKGRPDSVAVAAELRERMPENLDDMVVDFMTLRQDDHQSEESEALVAMASRKSVLAYLELLTGAGLEVDALDVGPAALARLVRHVGARNWAEFPLLPNVLLINFGAEASFLTVIWGRRLMLDRAVEFCEQRLLSRLKQVLDLPEELARPLLYGKVSSPAAAGEEETAHTLAEVLRPEITALLDEINKTLIYMASKTRGRSVDIIYLAGGAARHAGILKILREQLQVPVEILNPVAVFASPECAAKCDQQLGMQPGIALATGLALRELPDRG